MLPGIAARYHDFVFPASASLNLRGISKGSSACVAVGAIPNRATCFLGFLGRMMMVLLGRGNGERPTCRKSEIRDFPVEPEEGWARWRGIASGAEGQAKRADGSSFEVEKGPSGWTVDWPNGPILCIGPGAFLARLAAGRRTIRLLTGESSRR